MRAMETVQDLIEEAKVRTVWWAVAVFAISYFMSHTSKSMWTNIPMAIIILAFLRYLSLRVEFHWKVRPVRKQTHFTRMSKRQLSLNDLLSTVPPAPQWRPKVNSPLVEAAMESFVDKILRDFIVDLWYSSITSDREAPELIRSLILDALGELSGRVKEMNLLELLTRDMVNLIGEHLELYRRNQSEIGVDDMGTLSSKERDARLKQRLIASKKLHPALLSPEHEYKVLQQISGGVMSIVLRPQEAQSPLVRCFCRELITCVVLQPVMNFASPGFINELIVQLFLTNKEKSSAGTSSDTSNNAGSPAYNKSVSKGGTRQMESRNNYSTESSDFVLDKSNGLRTFAAYDDGNSNTSKGVSETDIQPRQADWAVGLDAATKRRSQVLSPENLESMWTKGRHYQKKSALMKAELPAGFVKSSGGVDNVLNAGVIGMELSPNFNERITSIDDKYMADLMHSSNSNTPPAVVTNSGLHDAQGLVQAKYREGTLSVYDSRTNSLEHSSRGQLKRSTSTPDIDATFLSNNGQTIGTQEISNIRKHEKRSSAVVWQSEGSLYVAKINCRVVGVCIEKLDFKRFAVYSVAVTDADDNTWFVKRRYRNFERLHQFLKEVPNYSLDLPPKSYLSLSINDSLVHERRVLLDRYLQDLLLIPNIAEQHEVWDFLSVSSKNYSPGKSISVMKTLAVNVDGAMDDIVRGFKRTVVGTSPYRAASSQLAANRTALSWNQEDKPIKLSTNFQTSRSLSNDDVPYEDQDPSVNRECHSDNEMNSKEFPSHVVKHITESSSLHVWGSRQLEKLARANSDSAKLLASIDSLEDLPGIPAEWNPANVSVPLLNLVDKVFQLERRGWLRRQVLWISKHILQLVMEDAIDDWILRQVHWLLRDDVIAEGINWVQDALWPNGTFFRRLDGFEETAENPYTRRPSESANHMFGDRNSESRFFEIHLETSRRANDVKKLLLDRTPAALISIIGYNQCHRSASDIYYFLQSTICVKQLAYAMLELVLKYIFPELKQLISDMHETEKAQ